MGFGPGAGCSASIAGSTDVDITGFPAGVDRSNTNDVANSNAHQAGGAPAVIRRGSF